MRKVEVASFDGLADRQPAHALVGEVDLVVVRCDDRVSVLYGRCLHRGALMADGHVDGDNLVCGVHHWDYRIDTGVSAYSNSEALARFASWVEDGKVLVDADEIAAWARVHPQPFDRSVYLGAYADTGHGTAEEPHNALIQRYAREGLSKTGHHGAVEAMGVPRDQLPSWDDIQILPAQLHRVAAARRARRSAPTSSIGPNAPAAAEAGDPAARLGHELRRAVRAGQDRAGAGAELAGTGICSGEGGMLPEEQQANSRYFYELASARFGFGWDKLAKVQAFHFKGGQGAKTGTGGHLPGPKVKGKIAEVRGLKEGEPAISPARFPDWTEPRQIRDFADEVRDAHRRHPGRLQAVGAAHREGHRRRARGRRRLHHPRRPRRRHRRGADHLPRQHLGADDSGAGARAAPPGPVGPPATSR